MASRFTTILGGVAAAAVAFGIAGAGPVQADEVQLKGLSGFPKSHKNTAGFLKWIDAVNAAGKGVVQIGFTGGPEVAPPPQQPTALRNGLVDIQFGPAAYYLGMFPEGDFTSGFKTPMESRALGGYEIMDKAYRQKLGATMLARFYQGLGLYMTLKQKPPMRADGLPNLSGMKIRSSPAYRDFVQELGATAVVMPITQLYTALERGLVDGAGSDLETVADMGMAKFLKVRIEPPFNMAGILLIANANKWDNLPPRARDIMMEKAIEFEKITMNEVAEQTRRTMAKLDEQGQEAIKYEGEVAKRYVDTYMKTPWGRMKNNPAVSVDVEALRKAWF